MDTSYLKLKKDPDPLQEVESSLEMSVQIRRFELTRQITNPKMDIVDY